jgi:hypothetical protein
VNEAAQQDPYPNDRRTSEETAGGLCGAFLARRRRPEGYLQLMGQPRYHD